jgi:hypothetical protein
MEQTTPYMLSLVTATVCHPTSYSRLPKILFNSTTSFTSILLRMSSISSLRGGYAQRRGRGGGNKPFTKSQREVVKPDTEKHPLGELLKSFSKADLKVDSNNAHKKESISGLRYIASYNWRSDSSTTIIVPGKRVS